MAGELIETLLSFDQALRNWIVSGAHPSWLDDLMRAASSAGNGAAIWFALVVVTGFARRSGVPAAFRAGLAILLTMLTVDVVLKSLIRRERPVVAEASLLEIADGGAATYSFPSGHTANSVAGALALSRAWPAAAPAFWTLAALVGVSRVFVGAHYPLDVLAGIFVGLACAWLVTGGAEAKERKPVRSPAPPGPRP